MITFKEYLEENSKPQKVAQFHGSDGTSVNVYARGDRHFAEITTKTGSNVSASSVFPNGSNADAQSKLDHVVLHTKKKNHKGALDILNQHSHLKFQHVTNEEKVEEAVVDVAQLKRKPLSQRTPREQAAIDAAKASKPKKGEVEVHLKHEDGTISKSSFRLNGKGHNIVTGKQIGRAHV